jgi:hypothetical protein
VSDTLSPGVAYGCFELLDIIENAATPLLLDTARNLGKLGVIAAVRVTGCALALGWAEVNERGEIIATARGQSVRAMPLTEHRLTRALLDIIEVTDPPWVQNARFGRRRFLEYAPIEIAQICEEAGLDEAADERAVAFWDTLAARARGLHDVRLNEIGREGERLTLAYEARRTGKHPKWIALESNEDGYDVLSQLADDDTRRLCIEVKASRQGRRGDFYLTRHEWETALSLLNFRMHLWDLSRSPPKLAVLNISDIETHLPVDIGAGAWDTAKVPFSAFEDGLKD